MDGLDHKIGLGILHSGRSTFDIILWKRHTGRKEHLTVIQMPI